MDEWLFEERKNDFGTVWVGNYFKCVEFLIKNFNILR